MRRGEVVPLPGIVDLDLHAGAASTADPLDADLA
jgi:hypothetical protein